MKPQKFGNFFFLTKQSTFHPVPLLFIAIKPKMGCSVSVTMEIMIDNEADCVQSKIASENIICNPTPTITNYKHQQALYHHKLLKSKLLISYNCSSALVDCNICQMLLYEIKQMDSSQKLTFEEKSLQLIDLFCQTNHYKQYQEFFLNLYFNVTASLLTSVQKYYLYRQISLNLIGINAKTILHVFTWQSLYT